MAIDHGHAENFRNPGVEYDKSDLGAKGILIFFVALAVFAIIMHLIVLGLYAGMTRVAEKQDRESNPLAPQTYTPRGGILTNTANVNVRQFPEPRLLNHMAQRGMGPTAQPGEMTKFLVEEAAALTAQPWQDAQGNIHLPIEQAMAAVLPRLTARSGGTQLPNYPGAARQYSYPPISGEAANRPIEMEPQSALPHQEQNPNSGEFENAPTGE
jgi:hypothetical protein